MGSDGTPPTTRPKKGGRGRPNWLPTEPVVDGAAADTFEFGAKAFFAAEHGAGFSFLGVFRAAEQGFTDFLTPGL